MKSIFQILSAAKSRKIAEAYNNAPTINEIENLGLHPDIQKHLQNENIYAPHVLNAVTNAARTLIKSGHETGLSDAKPKKGSSRAVFFPNQPHKIKLDGKDTDVHSVIKIAFPGHLDKHNDSGTLLGQHQNHVEHDWFAQSQWGVLRHNSDDGSYSTNHERGILAPVFNGHHDDHWLHMGRVRPAKAADWKELTKTKDFPKGITHNDMYHTLTHDYYQAHGMNYHFKPKEYDKLQEHPLIQNMSDFVSTMGQHPGDFHKGNMGVFEHPHGGKHLVISDYGFSSEVHKLYNNARKKAILRR